MGRKPCGAARPKRRLNRGGAWLSPLASPDTELSLLVPSYQHADFLPDLLSSIDRQTRPPSEILISDDGSTDGSWEQLRRWGRGRRNVRLFRQTQNLGISRNTNFLLKQARFGKVMFLHSDDFLLHPKALEVLGAPLLTDRTVVGSVCGKRFMGVDGDFGDLEILMKGGVHAGRQVIRRILWAESNIVGEPSCVMFRRKHLPDGFDSGLRQLWDVDAWLRLLRTGGLFYVAEPLVGIRRHAGQATEKNKRSGQLIGEHLAIFSAALEKEAMFLPYMERYRLFYKLARTARRHPASPLPKIHQILQSQRKEIMTWRHFWERASVRFGWASPP